MDGTLHQSEIGTVDTAILLASTGVFDIASPASSSKIGALTRIGGLTLFQRTLFNLQKGGISQVLTLVGEEEPTLRALIRNDDRIRLAVRWLPIREFPPSDPHTWETLGGEVKGSCLILGCHMVFAPSLIETLREGGREGRVVVAIGRPGHHGWVSNPGVIMRADPHPEVLAQRVVFHDSIQKPIDPGFGGGGGMAPAADLVVLPARLLGISGAWKTPQVGPIRLALEQAAAEGVVNTVSASTHGYLDARMPEGHKLAEQMLRRSLQTVKGSLDGAIDRFVNRKLSGVLTKAFIWLGLSPNVITILSMVIGLAGAVCFAHDLYFWGVVGALLFQLSVIIDCCDGEVARLTFSESPFGQELDIIADNIVHMAIFASIAWGSYAQGVWGESQLPLILGTVAVLANGLSLWLVNRVRYLKSNPLQWRRLAGGQRERLEFILSHVANRDFSVLVLLCAVFQVLPWFLGVAAIGSTFFVLTMLWTLRSSLLSSD